MKEYALMIIMNPGTALTLCVIGVMGEVILATQVAEAGRIDANTLIPAGLVITAIIGLVGCTWKIAGQVARLKILEDKYDDFKQNTERQHIELVKRLDRMDTRIGQIHGHMAANDSMFGQHGIDEGK